MSESNNLTCRLAYLGEGDDELSFLESLSVQISAPVSGVFSTRQLQEYQRFACDYCVLYPAAAAVEVIRSLISDASGCPSHPKIIMLLLKQSARSLEKSFKELGTQLQIIRLENPDKLRAVELINSFFISERQVNSPYRGWEFVGASAPVHALYNSIESFASWDKDPVLISGETGTGKELIARRLHEIRGIGHFCAYNAAAIPLELTESLLFGHTKGAFTDAKSEKEGYIVNAANGTLFIDEIGDVHPAIQVKLLRTLQERKVLRVGAVDSRAKEISARFLFATNRDLKKACRKNKFREDFFHRISVLQIEVPPLRQRRTDIPLLAQYFVEELNNDYANGTTKFYLDNVFALNVLFDYEWTGNVRELRNVVRQAAALTSTGAIDKKLAELVDKKIRELVDRGLQPNPSQGDQRSRESSSFISSLLDDTRPKAKSRFEKAYNQALFIKTNGICKEMMELADIGKTVANEVKNDLILSQFKTEDLIDAASLATKLKQQTDPVSTYIRSRFNSHTKNMLSEYRGENPDVTLLSAMVKELNLRLQDTDLYQADRFHQIQLSENTQDLIKQHGAWTDLFRLNRMLIEDTYPHEIMKNTLIRGNSNWNN